MTPLQKKFNDTAGTSLSFLDDSLDPGLIGYAVSARSAPIACYSVLKLKVELRNNNVPAKRIFESMNSMLTGDPESQKIGVLLNLSKTATWDRIRTMRLPRWDNLDTGVCGILRTSRFGDSIAYSVPAVVRILDNITSDPSSKFEELTALESKVAQSTFLEEKIIPVCLYPQTPFFIYFLK